MIYLITNFIIGACLASHACLICDRLAEGETWLGGRSHCLVCQHELHFRDEIPLLSYLLLHGRCNYCSAPIPLKLFLTELIGGFAFLKINFASFNDCLRALFLFCLLLSAIEDQGEQEFSTIFLLFPLVVLLFWPHLFAWRQGQINLLSLLPMALLLVYFCWQKKMGWGDFWIYLLIAAYFQPVVANRSLFLAALLFLLRYALERNNPAFKQTAFVPYLFLALVFNLLA